MQGGKIKGGSKRYGERGWRKKSRALGWGRGTINGEGNQKKKGTEIGGKKAAKCRGGQNVSKKTGGESRSR